MLYLIFLEHGKLTSQNLLGNSYIFKKSSNNNVFKRILQLFVHILVNFSWKLYKINPAKLEKKTFKNLTKTLMKLLQNLFTKILQNL
jgi:hypothetical protein